MQHVALGVDVVHDVGDVGVGNPVGSEDHIVTTLAFCPPTKGIAGVLLKTILRTIVLFSIAATKIDFYVNGLIPIHPSVLYDRRVPIKMPGVSAGIAYIIVSSI